MGLFSSNFYDQIKDEQILGMLQGAFTYETGKGGAMKRACNMIITNAFLVVIYDPIINVAPGIFGFSTTDNFKNNIGNAKVITNSNQTIAQLAPDPKTISQAVPLEKVELVSMVYFTVGGGMFDTFKSDVGMIHLRMGGKFLGMRENMIFTLSEFDNVVNMFKQTSLGSKLEVKKEHVNMFLENME